jgi:hypothetical protein
MHEGTPTDTKLQLARHSPATTISDPQRAGDFLPTTTGFSSVHHSSSIFHRSRNYYSFLSNERMTLRSTYMKTPSLSPIPSMGSKTSFQSRRSHESHEALLQSSPISVCFSLQDMEQSFSSIDLDSLVFFSETNIDLKLHLPTTEPLPRRASAFVEHLPIKTEHDCPKPRSMGNRCKNVLCKVRKRMACVKNPKGICGVKEAVYDSDSNSDVDISINSDSLRGSTASPQFCILATREHEPIYASSVYTPNTTDTSIKRRAIYGTNEFRPDFPFTMDSALNQPHTCESLHSPRSNSSTFHGSPDTSPSVEYQKRRKSAFAILG